VLRALPRERVLEAVQAAPGRGAHARPARRGLLGRELVVRRALLARLGLPALRVVVALTELSGLRERLARRAARELPGLGRP
jgi:hypothetical protein